MFLTILIFLLLEIAIMVVSFVLHRGRPLMPVPETSTMELDLSEFPTFPGDVDLRSFPYQLFRIFSSPPEQCIICLGRFKAHHQLISLPLCGHVFHSYCIRSWLHNNQNCPLCRQGIVVVNNDDNISTTSSDGYPFINSTAATDGSLSSSEEDDLNASSSSSVLPRDSFEEYTFLNGTMATDDSCGLDPLPVDEEDLDDDHMAVASSKTPPPQDSFQIFDDEIVEESSMVAEEEMGCFSRCFTFICPKKFGAPRESGSGESHVVGESPVLAVCFSRCSKVIKGGLMKFRAPRKAGGGCVRVRLFSRCFDFITKPKKNNS